MNCGISLACAFLLIVSFQSSDAYSSHFISGVNGFSNNFFEILAKQSKGNLIASPISALTVLSMGICGADGATRQEALYALELSLNEISVLKDYRNFILELQNSTKVELHLANKIFVQNKFPIRKRFSALMKTIFQSEIENINLGRAKMAAEEINAWCRKQTRNKISSIIKPDDLMGIQMVMINAVYFKGMWAEPFESELIDEKFYISKDNSVVLPMMFKKVINAERILDNDAFYIELPYETDEPQNQLSMFVILPWRNATADSIAHKLHGIDFRQLDNPCPDDPAYFLMPKFKIESELDIIPTLKAMGIREIFGNDASFKYLSLSPDLKIEKMIQKGFLSVDEKGSEAAVVTADFFSDRIAPLRLVVNKPFFLAIVNKSTGTPLFWARINDPRI